MTDYPECPDCDGKGRAALPPYWKSETCVRCEGTGEIVPFLERKIVTKLGVGYFNPRALSRLVLKPSEEPS